MRQQSGASFSKESEVSELPPLSELIMEPGATQHLPEEVALTEDSFSVVTEESGWMIEVIGVEGNCRFQCVQTNVSAEVSSVDNNVSAARPTDQALTDVTNSTMPASTGLQIKQC